MFLTSYPSSAIIKRMDKKYVVLNKEAGETPLALLDRFRGANSWVGDKKLTYAGRLDPMASGKMIVLVGEECKKKEEYLSLDKEYEFEILFGFSSDTGDVLGLVENEDDGASRAFDADELSVVTQKFIGEISLPYPAFSSKTVSGKPLFVWALEGRLNEIDIPLRESVIYKLSLKEARTISKEELRAEIFEKIAKVKPTPLSEGQQDFLGKDFRKKEILERWGAALNKASEKKFQIAKFVCIASSGTYMRTLATEIGKSLNTKTLAFSIHRTKIGEYQH